MLAVGRPAGALSDALGLAAVKDKLVGWAHPDDGLSAARAASTRRPPAPRRAASRR